ncbi:MAG TPA: hypothetical protein VGQ13_05655 [Nitrososphaera sp.]|nr:hypothetical protein [Nitrososphaera sp.]
MDRLGELVGQAKTIVAGDPDRTSMWRAYVALEYAIMDLKLRHNLEGEAAPERPTKQAIDIIEARSMLARIDLSSDRKKLLYDLRSCRNVVKALVANYDRRSTTS